MSVLIYSLPKRSIGSIIVALLAAFPQIKAQEGVNIVDGSITVGANHTLVVGGIIKNQKSAANFIVESDANLLQISNTQNSGEFIVLRKAEIKRLDYVYWSSPVQNQMLKAFSPGTLDARFMTYNEATDYFTSVPAPKTTAFIPAKGYAIRADNRYPAWSGAPVVTDFRNFVGAFIGTVNNGPQPFALAKSRNGYNLVGNPYPSDIDLDGDQGVFAQNSNSIEPVAYFWNNRIIYSAPASGQEYNGENYAIYNKSGSVPSSNSTKKTTGIVKVGQGFIVQAKTTGKSLNFTNNSRVAGSSADIFYHRNQSKSKDRFWLQLTTPNNDFNTILIAYLSEASNDFELGYDAPLMSIGSDSFYSVLNDYQLGIQGRRYPMEKTDRVILGSHHFTAGNHMISLQDAEGIFEADQPVYLKDKATGTVTNLSERNYEFNADQGITEGRFEIIYQADTTLNTGVAAKEGLTAYRDGADYVIKSTAKTIKEVTFYDAVGRMVLHFKPDNKEIKVNLNQLTPGVYIVKINHEGALISKKILK